MSAPVVEGEDLVQTYEIGRGLFRPPARLQAVGGVSFRIAPGKTLAVVGESGCGKSTLGRMVALIEKPTAGALRLDRGRAHPHEDASAPTSPSDASLSSRLGSPSA